MDCAIKTLTLILVQCKYDIFHNIPYKLSKRSNGFKNKFISKFLKKSSNNNL